MARAFKRGKATDSPAEPVEGSQTEDPALHSNVIMTVAVAGPHIGVAVYEACDQAVTVLQGNEDGKAGQNEHQLLQLVKMQVNPDVIYVSSKSEGCLLEVLRQPIYNVQTDMDLQQGTAARQLDAGTAEEYQAVDVKMERAAAFAYDKALKRLEGLQVGSHMPSTDGRAHLALLNTMVDLSLQQQVCALGALITVLRKARAVEHRGEEEGPLLVTSLSELKLQSYLQVDQHSMAALQLIQEERHPSHMGLGKAKEGFSLFSLLNTCVTPMGKRLMRTWFMRPVLDLSVISNRQDAVQLLQAAPDPCKQLAEHLKQVGDVPRLLQRMQQGRAKPELADFTRFRDSLMHMLEFKETVSELLAREEQALCGHTAADDTATGRRPGTTVADDGLEMSSLRWQGLHVISEVMEHLSACPALSDAHALVSAVVDEEHAAEGFIVARGVCPQLDEMKDTYEGLPDLLTRVLEAELVRVPPRLARLHAPTKQLWSISYLPQVGYAIQVTPNELPDDVLEVLPDYQQAFEMDTPDGHSVFYSADSTQELSKQFGDMLYKIQDLEASVVTELVQRLQQHAAELQRASHVMAHMDCLLAFTRAATQLNYTRPVLTADNSLTIIAGRHPLTETVAPQSFIPNDTHMGVADNRLHVITGPNASGKSCYAKQVAVIVFMAHLGCYVPAERAVVGLTDRILTRLVSQEQVATGCSAFKHDCTQVSRMLRQATERSLLVIDEFGKGTLAADGVGLLSALLTEFRCRQQPPRLLACTHFHELLNPEVLPRHPLIQFYTMELLINGVQGSMPTASVKNGLQENTTQPDGTAAVTAAPEAAQANPAHSGEKPDGQVGSAATAVEAVELQVTREHAAAKTVAEAGVSGDSEVVFLYRLVRGYCAPSFGVRCAQLCGVRPDVVQRAWQVLASRRAQQPLPVNPQALPAARSQLFTSWAQQLQQLLQAGRKPAGPYANAEGAACTGEHANKDQTGEHVNSDSTAAMRFLVEVGLDSTALEDA